MDCNDARNLLQACADGEVGAADSVRLERHLEDCEPCVESLRNLQALRAAARHGAQYHRAPADLRARIVAALPGDAALPAAADDSAAAPAPSMPEGWRRWFTWPPAINAAMALVTAVAVGLGLQQFALRESPADATADAVVASHVRGLMSNRAIDVASSDQHTVKPWFNGRIDYAPEVRDLAAAGFPLQGGRLDYVDGHRVAVLVYRRDAHPIDVFVIPGDNAGRLETGGGELVRQGYPLQRWTAHGMHYWAVTDASAATLRAFVQAWRNAEGAEP
ncbi:anti-sigma factor family protein [Cupriavidus campinensis]